MLIIYDYSAKMLILGIKSQRLRWAEAISLHLHSIKFEKTFQYISQIYIFNLYHVITTTKTFQEITIHLTFSSHRNKPQNCLIS